MQLGLVGICEWGASVFKVYFVRTFEMPRFAADAFLYFVKLFGGENVVFWRPQKRFTAA